MKAVDQAALAAATASAEIQGQTMSGPFAPGLPLTPYDGVSGMPRAWDFPTGYNIKARADRDGRMPFNLLKTLTETYDVAAMCISHRIDDVRSLDWSVRLDDSVEKTDTAASDYVDRAKKALRKPDGRNTFRSWLAMFLQDVLRYDAGTLYRRRNMLGQVCALEVVSGMTIAPVQDYYGRRPIAPAPAYVQYVNGTPWEWLTEDDLIYQPFRPQPDSPYGVSPIEAVLLAANTDMRFQQHWMNWFTEGNIPEGFATAPADITTPDQLERWQAYWEAMNTDTRVKHKLKMVPNGTVLQFPQEKNFDPTFPEYLMRKVCAAYHVTPNDLGFTETVNRATGDTQVDVQFRIGTLPLVQHVQDILTEYLQADLGLPVVFEFDTGQESEDRVATAQANKIYIESGVVSVDEVREKEFGLQTDAGRPTPRFIFSTRQGPIPLRSLLAIAGAIDPQTAGPADDAPLDTTPFAGAAGVIPDKTPGAPLFQRAPTDPDVPDDPAAEVPVPGSGVIQPVKAPPAVAKELARWRTNTLTRLGRGQRPRRFESDVIPAPMAEVILKRLGNARTVDDVDRIFKGADAGPKAGTPNWRDDPPVRTPQHEVDLQLTDYWAPKIVEALQALWSASDLSAAITMAMYNRPLDSVVKDDNSPVTHALMGTADTSKLDITIDQAWVDAYNAGTHAGAVQTGADASFDWSDWKPGLNQAQVTGGNGWAAAMEKANLTIRDITATTASRVADAIEQGVASGDSVQGITRSLSGVIGDPGRAELIAHTESARMLTNAAMDQYRAMGVTQWDLVVSAGACPTCLDVAAANPHPVQDGGDQPPIHPRCRCAATPRLDSMANATPGPLPAGTDYTSMQEAYALLSPPPVPSIADTLTMESTASWSDDELVGKITEYADDPDAVDKILSIIDQRDAAGQADLPAPKDINQLAAELKPSTDPAVNPAAIKSRKLTPADRANEEYDNYVYNQYAKALDDLAGNFYNNKLKEAALRNGYDELTMFQGSYRNVEKYASEELKQWWYENGRETQGSFRYQMLKRPADKRFADVVQRLGFGNGKASNDRSAF